MSLPEKIEAPQRSVGERLASGELLVDSVEQFHKEVLRSAEKLHCDIQKLGDACGFPLYMIRREGLHDGPRVVIATGFHGEEPAGPWGLAEFLSSTSNEALRNVNLTILPLINGSGFSKRTRKNVLGENPNLGFPSPVPNEAPSEEVKVLLPHLPYIVDEARDGFLTLHEDDDMKHFYLYTHGESSAESKYVDPLLRVGSRPFGLVPERQWNDDGAYEVINGVCHDPMYPLDTTFDAFLARKGIPGVCTETPGKGALSARINTNQELVRVFLEVVRR